MSLGGILLGLINIAIVILVLIGAIIVWVMGLLRCNASVLGELIDALCG